jgi:hypothetical protein
MRVIQDLLFPPDKGNLPLMCLSFVFIRIYTKAFHFFK